MNLPNGITVARIGAAPVLFALILSGGFELHLLAFVIFIAAGLSDLWDGYIARRRGEITEFGKLADPIADKLLVFATFIPFYIVSHRTDLPAELMAVPWWGPLPLWVLIVILGRELLITAFRAVARRQGVVIAAGTAGKYKTLSQNFFIGSLILWYVLQYRALERGWSGGFWTFWQDFHGAFVGGILGVAVFLTAYSLIVYFWRYRTVMSRAT